MVNLLKTTKKCLTFFVDTKISYNKPIPQNRDISEILEHRIKNYENHSSIVAIKNNRNLNDQFPFKPVTEGMIAKKISKLKTRKAVRSNDIPTKVLKDLPHLYTAIIKALARWNFS